MLHTQQHIHVYNRQKNEAIVVRKSATKNDFAVKTKFFYFFLVLLLYAGRTGSSNTNPAKVEAYYRDIEQVYSYF